MLVEYNMIRERGKEAGGTITLWELGGVEVLNGMHTQLGIISIPLSIDLVGTGSKSSNDVHHGNFLFACYIFSSRVIFLC